MGSGAAAEEVEMGRARSQEGRWEVGGKNVGLGANCEVKESREASAALGRQHREFRQGARDKLEGPCAKPSGLGRVGVEICAAWRDVGPVEKVRRDSL